MTLEPSKVRMGPENKGEAASLKEGEMVMCGTYVVRSSCQTLWNLTGRDPGGNLVLGKNFCVWRKA